MNEIGILNISDIHLGHNKNHTVDIVNNLFRSLLNPNILLFSFNFQCKIIFMTNTPI
jgi:hypothetical protein